MLLPHAREARWRIAGARLPNYLSIERLTANARNFPAGSPYPPGAPAQPSFGLGSVQASLATRGLGGTTSIAGHD